jgi:hypothetical protein
MMSRPGSKGVKLQLFLKCGRVDMYNLEIFSKEKLQLHHDPPFRQTHHTIYEESYLLSEDTHTELHKLELDNHDEYNRRMEIIKKNKKILEKIKENK